MSIALVKNTALIKYDLLQSLKDKEFREAFTLENVYTGICFQIRALREERDKSQKELGRMVKPMMAQERISILEDPNAETKPSITTLLRLAAGLDVGLEVRFVPFSTVLKHSVETDTKNLRVKSFNQELPNLEAEIERHLSAAAGREGVEDQIVAKLGSAQDDKSFVERDQVYASSPGLGTISSSRNPSIWGFCQAS